MAIQEMTKARKIHMHTPCMEKIESKSCIQIGTCNKISLYSLILMSNYDFLLLLFPLSSITKYPNSSRVLQENYKYRRV